MDSRSIGEGQIDDKLLKKVAPDVVAKSGQQKLMAKMMAAHQMRDMLDKALAMGSNNIGATFSSRLKSMDTAQKKIAQKRLQGRDYGIEDLGDLLGGRIVVNSPKDYDKAEGEIREMEKQGIFKIKKRENVKTGNYEAIHFDLLMPNGTKAETQIHTKLSEAEALANHDIRTAHGENPEGVVKALRDKQADIIEHLHPDRAKALSHAIALLHKQNGEQPISAIETARLVKNASS